MDTALHPVHHERRRIRYREPWLRHLPAVLLPLGLALLLSAALAGGRVPLEAAPMLRLVALGGFGAAGVAVALALRGLRQPGYVELLDEAVVLPESSPAHRLLRVPYVSIQSLFIAHVSGQDVLVLRSSLGESRLLARGFPCRRDFDAFTAAIRRRIRGHGRS